MSAVSGPSSSYAVPLSRLPRRLVALPIVSRPCVSLRRSRVPRSRLWLALPCALLSLSHEGFACLDPLLTLLLTLARDQQAAETLCEAICGPSATLVACHPFLLRPDFFGASVASGAASSSGPSAVRPSGSAGVSVGG